jgi:3-dehydroquinate dehydratase-1
VNRKFNFTAGPYVVGTLSSFESQVPLACDVVEVRLDKTGRPENWLERCGAIEAGGKPVLLTVRLQQEGGDWIHDDETRFKIYMEALPHISAIDVELRSAWGERLAKEAADAEKICVISYHDFHRTPPLAELEDVVEQAHCHSAAAKVATFIQSPDDVEVLCKLLEKKRTRPVCAIAMGEAWKETRITFPRLGSWLTYGYLDRLTAPGQWPAEELGRRLRPVEK